MMQQRITRRAFRATLVVAVAGATAMLTACGSGGSESTTAHNTSTGQAAGATNTVSGEPITIGIASAQSGDFSFADVPVAVGVKMAVEDVNKKGGILGRPVKVVTADTQSDPKQGAQAALDVLDKGANVVVPMCDYNLGLTAAQTAQQKDVVAYGCAGSALWGPRGAGPLAFSVNTGTQTEGAAGAQFAADKGWKRAYLLVDTSNDYSLSWCAAFATRYKELGGQIVGRNTFQMGDTSLSSQVTGIKTSGSRADVLAVCGFQPTAGVAVKQIRDGGLKTPIVGTATFEGPEWAKAIPGVSDVYGVTVGSLYGDDPNPAVNELFDRYQKETGKQASLSFALYGYAIVQAFNVAVTEAGTTSGSAVAAALSKFKDQPLIVVPPTTYSATCHVAKGRQAVVVQYQNGKGSYLATIKPTNIPPFAGC